MSEGNVALADQLGKQHTMIRNLAIAALAVVTFASAPMSSARSEPSNAEIAAGLGWPSPSLEAC